jgi:alpha-amylase
MRIREKGLAQHLIYDAYERRSGLIRVLAPEATPDDWATGRATELGDVVDGAFAVEQLAAGRLVTRRDATIGGATIRIVKTLTLGGNRRAPTLTEQVDLEHRAGPEVDGRVGVEWALTMLGGGGNPAAWWDVGGERTGHDTSGTAADLSTIAQGNDDIGVSVTTTTSPADAWWAPIETVSNSEAGFERVYQGSALLLSWPVRMAPGDRWTRTIVNTVDTARDRAEDDT